MENNKLITNDILCKALYVYTGERFKFVHCANENQNKFIDRTFYIENDKIVCTDGTPFDERNIYQILAGFYNTEKV
jgi:hypothetical protein